MAVIIDPARNFAKCTIENIYDETDVLVLISPEDEDLFPDTLEEGPFNLVWWNFTDYPDPSDDPEKEIVRCSVRIGGALSILRGQENTVPTPKNKENKVYKLMLSFTQFVFDQLRNSIYSCVSEALVPITTYTYDVNDNLTQIEKSTGEILYFEYVNELLTSITSSTGWVKTLFYSDNTLIRVEIT